MFACPAVIGGYIPGAHGVDAIVVGYYRGEDVMTICGIHNLRGYERARTHERWLKNMGARVEDC